MLLFAISLVLSLAIIIILFGNLNGLSQKKIQSISLFASILSFCLSLFFLIFFDRSCSEYQFLLVGLYPGQEFSFNFFNRAFSLYFDFLGYMPFGVDGISLFFILLSTFIIPLCLLTS